MTLGAAGRWLLVGNSRWHWAEQSGDGQLRGWDERASEGGQEKEPPLAWAAVGRCPNPRICPPEREVGLEDVPLLGCPPWLGVDRALAGWEAWQNLQASVLVVDAGTVLSFTRVDRGGSFQGGRLLAGLRLQLEAMAQGSTLIPQILSQACRDSTEGEDREDGTQGDPAWPRATAAAMRVGVERGLAAAVIEAARESTSEWVMFTGGDSAMLGERTSAELELLGLSVAHRPLLCLESLARLRPAPRS